MMRYTEMTLRNDGMKHKIKTFAVVKNNVTIGYINVYRYVHYFPRLDQIKIQFMIESERSFIQKTNSKDIREIEFYANEIEQMISKDVSDSLLLKLDISERLSDIPFLSKNIQLIEMEK